MTTTADKNRRVARIVLIVVAAMIGLSFASVPLYDLFCRITGFGGTPQMSKTLPDHVDARQVTVTFDARVDTGLPWQFGPEKRKVTVHIGQQGMISFKAVNHSARTTVGTALYNVTPEKIGKYFNKTQCFCFAEQALEGGKDAHFPVLFYIDPAILKDPEMENITDITLSYTFFPAGSQALDKAMTQLGQGKK
jgi:cytochrome c oxidase assembly protein subunit 11